ncbi:MAG: Na+/H+ antiporter NhaC family protein [Acidobacteriota bacterium]
MSERRFRVPHTLVLLFSMVILAYIATLVLPQGEFERQTNEKGREEVVAGSYQHLEEGETQPPWVVLTAVPKGMEAAAEVIFFIFIIGGFFGVFRATGASDASIGWLLNRLRHRPGLLIFGGMLIFAVGSSTIGMAEEYLPFVPLLLVMTIGLGMDAVVAVGLLCVGYGVGYGTAVLNPFTVVVAWSVADLPPSSGQGYRLILLVVFLAVGFHHVWSYAKRVRDNPSSSLVADIEPDPSLQVRTDVPVTWRHLGVLAALAFTLGLLVWGIKVHEWYLIPMGATFVALSVVIAAIAWISADKAASAFCEGAAELTTTALLVGVARGIQVVLDDGQVVDTIIHGISQPLESLNPALSAAGMFLVQSACNLFIPSGSGQAYVTMPLMAPLADLVGISRQTAVLAFQFGDGFTNILVPTNAVLVGILAMARIPYDRWVRFILPFMIKVWILGSIALAITVWFPELTGFQ